jgi:hypothetical protein
VPAPRGAKLAGVGPLRIALGLVVVLVTGAGMVATLVMPRGKSAFHLIGATVTRSVRLVVVGISRLFKDFEIKDGILSTIGPLSLLAQLGAFLGLFLVGYSIAMWPYAGSYGLAAREAGSSLFTIGLAQVGGPSSDVLVIMAAATGAVAIALQIGYLPAIYQAFNRRESLVTLMEARAGLPAWGPEVLARHQLIQTLDALPGLYSDWEMWAAEVAESHTSYPVLLYFRSPQPWYSWVLALLAILDACAMQLALSPATASSEARMCLRMGFTALRRIASTLGWEYEADPLPDAPLQLTYAEFEYAVEVLVATGFPTERSPAEAWPHFQGWRVNYESIAYKLADRVVAPRAPWSGERRHLSEVLTTPRRPPHRSPEGGVADETRHRPGGHGPSSPVDPSGRWLTKKLRSDPGWQAGYSGRPAPGGEVAPGEQQPAGGGAGEEPDPPSTSAGSGE